MTGLTPAERVAEVVEDGLAIWQAWGASIDQLNDWMMGTATGGPNHDGRYPLTNRAGVVKLLPCPAAQGGQVISGTFAWTPVAGEVLIAHVFPAAASFPANFAGSVGRVRGTPPGSTLTLTVRRIGTANADIGTITIAANRSVSFATTGGAAQAFARGDSLIVLAMAPDGATSDVDISLVAA